MGIVIGLESRQLEVHGDEIVVGRSPTAQISLPGEPRLFDRHAVLRRVAGRWLIEAQGDAAIRVGDGRPGKVAWLNPGDVIHLTESGPLLTFSPVAAAPIPAGTPVVTLADSGPIRLAQPAAPPPPVPPPAAIDIPPALAKAFDDEDESPRVPPLARKAPPEPSVPATEPFRLPSGSIPAAGAAVAIVLVAGLLAAFNLPGSKPVTITPPVLPDGQTPTGGTPPVAGVAAPPAKRDPAAAIHRVLLQDPKFDSSRQVGVAWAVGPRRLVTSAVVAQRIIQRNQELLPKAIVQVSDASPAIEIAQTLLHPDFERLAAEAHEAEKRLEEMWGIVDDTPDKAIPDDLRPHMLKAQDRLKTALLEAVNFDVAILTVDQDLPETLQIADDSAAARSGAAIRLLEPLAKKTTAHLGTVQLKVPASGEVRHWLVAFAEFRPSEKWDGSPILNDDGRVIGIYSRPVLELDDPPDSAPTMYKVAAADRVKDIRGGLP